MPAGNENLTMTLPLPLPEWRSDRPSDTKSLLSEDFRRSLWKVGSQKVDFPRAKCGLGKVLKYRTKSSVTVVGMELRGTQSARACCSGRHRVEKISEQYEKSQYGHYHFPQSSTISTARELVRVAKSVYYKRKSGFRFPNGTHVKTIYRRFKS